MDDADDFVAALDPATIVVTTVARPDGEMSGCLVGFAAQVSIDPWRLLVCISKENHTFRTAQRATHLAVHRLGVDDREVSGLFGEQSGDDVDKFAHCSWHQGPEGVPVLEDLVVLVGRIVERVDLGDHVGHLIAPVALDGPAPEGPPLRLSDVSSMTPGHPRTSDGQ